MTLRHARQLQQALDAQVSSSHHTLSASLYFLVLNFCLLACMQETDLHASFAAWEAEIASQIASWPAQVQSLEGSLEAVSEELLQVREQVPSSDHDVVIMM